MSLNRGDLELADEVAKYYADPLGFVLFAYPWKEPGSLKDSEGPDEWQREFLSHLGEQVRKRGFNGVRAVEPIREAVSSGHGIGKSTVSGWLANWIMSTRPNSQGTVTANTFPQLQSKTWAAIQKWTRLCITSHWFNVGADRITAKVAPESWFCSAQTCREENSESFAGQHAADSTSWYLFDEASAIPDKIWEVAEGGLTDGEPMFFAWGNPTRNSGKFHRVVFGSERNRWSHRTIDSRRSRFTNKALIGQWVEDYGEDSDFVRVRVRGLAPRASDLQFIDADRVYEAQQRETVSLPDDPLVVGLDVARGGGDNNVFWFRRGLDASSIPPIVIPGEETRDSMRLVSKLLEVMDTPYNGQKPAAAFVDGTGIGGPIVDRCRQLGHKNVIEIQFGWKSPNPKMANMRAFMWGSMKDWLQRGSIPKSAQLEIDLTAPGYHHNASDQVVLEAKEQMKKRDLASPDHGDALALTFAQPVTPEAKRVEVEYPYVNSANGWMA